MVDTTAFTSLGADINKSKGKPAEENREGVVSEKLPELTLDMSDEDIIKLTNKWEKVWNDSNAKSQWEKASEENEKYWLGKHFTTPEADKDRAMVDNLIFESLETYLPQVTRRNPEPLVTLDHVEDAGTEQQQNPVAEQLAQAESQKKEKYVEKVKGRLADLADKNKIRLKLKKAARYWAVYMLGVAKFGWDLDKAMPVVRILRPKRIILDPEATIDEDGYTGNRIGEYRRLPASQLLAIIGNAESAGKAKTKIEEKIKDSEHKSAEGTEIQFVEWWTPEYMCWKLDSTILLKKKNPHWNYEGVSAMPMIDEFGAEIPAPPAEPINHFEVPQMPYAFLSVYNLGDQPMDKTSLIGQNLANQDLLNKRNKQIDKNADGMNGGMVVSLARSGLTASAAKTVTSALRKGGTVVIPDGAPRDAVDRFPAQGLPADVYNQLADMRDRMRDIFGTRGSTPAGIEGEKTVRGKIMNRSMDTDRIGGGVSEYLEQFADGIYNWFVQMLYVYDTGFQFVPGAMPPRIVISVKEGSLLPKDSTTIANQAIELALAGKMALLDLYKRLEYPNPEELAANVWLELNAPQLLYQNNPMVQQAMMQMQAAAAAEAEANTAAVEGERTAEKETADTAHQNDMEKENLKADTTIKKSILSAVPTKSA